MPVDHTDEGYFIEVTRAEDDSYDVSVRKRIAIAVSESFEIPVVTVGRWIFIPEICRANVSNWEEVLQ